MALAYRAGVPLKDMEFVQYHPTGLPGTGILITEAARGEGGILINKDGYRYLQDYDLGPPDPMAAPEAQWSSGRATGCRRHSGTSRARAAPSRRRTATCVHLDIRHLGEKKINKRLPFVRELAQNYAGIDPVHEPIPVRPGRALHDGRHQHRHRRATPLPGLFAAGECACVQSTAPTASARTR